MKLTTIQSVERDQVWEDRVFLNHPKEGIVTICDIIPSEKAGRFNVEYFTEDGNEIDVIELKEDDYVFVK